MDSQVRVIRINWSHYRILMDKSDYLYSILFYSKVIILILFNVLAKREAEIDICVLYIHVYMGDLICGIAVLSLCDGGKSWLVFVKAGDRYRICKWRVITWFFDFQPNRNSIVPIPGLLKGIFCLINILLSAEISDRSFDDESAYITCINDRNISSDNVSTRVTEELY